MRLSALKRWAMRQGQELNRRDASIRFAWLAVAFFCLCSSRSISDDPLGLALDDSDYAIAWPSPPWRVPRYPIITLPLNGRSPEIDGRIDPESEWGDAVALSGFFQVNLKALAPAMTQPVMWLKVDAEQLYAALRSPIYPEGASLRAFERRAGKLSGIMQDDHVFLEVLPLPTRRLAALRQAGSFALVWNVLGTLGDLHVGINPGGMGQELWNSGAQVANHVDPSNWETEVRQPLERFRSGNMEREIVLPPEAGQFWSFNMARRFGLRGSNLFSAWIADQPVFQKDWNDQHEAWNLRGMLRFSDDAVAVQLLDVGDPSDGRFDFDLRLSNVSANPHSVKVDIAIQRLDGTVAWKHESENTVAPGERLAVDIPPAQVELDAPFGSRLFIRIVQDDGQLLYLTPGVRLASFDDELRRQYRRSLEVLR